MTIEQRRPEQQVIASARLADCPNSPFEKSPHSFQATETALGERVLFCMQCGELRPLKAP